MYKVLQKYVQGLSFLNFNVFHHIFFIYCILSKYISKMLSKYYQKNAKDLIRVVHLFFKEICLITRIKKSLLIQERNNW